MALTGHSSKDQVVSTGNRYTGLVNMVIKSVNPTLEELKASGVNTNKEPVYVTDEIQEERDGIPGFPYRKNRLAFTLYSPQYKFYSYLSIWLEDRIRWNQKHDKVEWVNKFGVTTWSPDESTNPHSIELTKWFKPDGARPALGGEGKLTMLLRAWLNCGEEDQAILDNPKAVANGDLTELRKAFAAFPNNEVKVLTGIKKVEKDGKVNFYPTIYDAFFDRPYRNDYAAWNKALMNEWTKFEADFQNDLMFRAYLGNTKIVGESPTNLDVPGGTNGSGMPDSTSVAPKPLYDF